MNICWARELPNTTSSSVQNSFLGNRLHFRNAEVYSGGLVHREHAEQDTFLTTATSYCRSAPIACLYIMPTEILILNSHNNFGSLVHPKHASGTNELRDNILPCSRQLENRDQGSVLCEHLLAAYLFWTRELPGFQDIDSV